MKKRLILAIIVLAVSFFSLNVTAVAAEENNNADKELSDKINEIIDATDFSEFEKYLDESSGVLAENTDFKSLLVALAKGQGLASDGDISKYIFSLIFIGVKNKIPILVSLFVMLVLCSVLGCFASDKPNGVSGIIKFIGYASVACTVAMISVSLVGAANDSCRQISKIIQITFPVLLAFITASGGVSQATIYSPTMLFLQNFTTVYISKILFPLISTMLALSIISNISKCIKLQGFIDFISSFMKWSIGLTGVLFSVMTTIKGFSAGAFDGAGIRTLKYAVGSTIPIVGGMLSGSADIVFSAITLTKNAFGILSVVILFGVVIKPVIEIAALTFALRLVGAITQPMTDNGTYSFIKSCVSTLNFALAGIVVVALMYILTIILIIMSSGMV